MVDLMQISPAEIGRQLGNPSGEIGLAVGQLMNASNTEMNREAYRRVRLCSGEHVLEIGPGNGAFIHELLANAADASYTGVDISETMLTAAKNANRDQVTKGDVRFELASVDNMPFADSSFDKAVTANCIYFWPNVDRALKEIRRCLAPGGTLIVAANTPETMGTIPAAKAEFGFRNLFDAAGLERVHRNAGFSSVSVDSFQYEGKARDGTPVVRTCTMVTSVR
jgi:ubiquinone/menaquinone biosynthesis C-methylase UbiE